MARETMMSEERMWAAIELEKVDRVPIHPLVGIPAAAGLLGLRSADLYADADKGIDALLQVFDKFGGWDAINRAATSILDWNLSGYRAMIPGRDLPPSYSVQYKEEEVLKVEDYKKIEEMGWRDFLKDDFMFRLLNMTSSDIHQAEQKMRVIGKRWDEDCRKRGVPFSFAPLTPTDHPFFWLSLNRSLLKFTEDLYYRPEPVQRAIEIMTEEWTESAIKSCKEGDHRIIWFAEERAEASFFPLKIFERFWWPYTKRMIETLNSHRIVAWMHLDGCWDKNLHYFKEIPRASAVVALDGITDIFAAKKLLRNHLCIASDVQAALLSLGKPEDVKAYCERLIRELGVDGGHILSSGCEVPATCKPENLRAMIETGKTFRA